jgi:hypothetical protein
MRRLFVPRFPGREGNSGDRDGGAVARVLDHVERERGGGQSRPERSTAATVTWKRVPVSTPNVEAAAAFRPPPMPLVAM